MDLPEALISKGPVLKPCQSPFFSWFKKLPHYKDRYQMDYFLQNWQFQPVKSQMRFSKIYSKTYEKLFELWASAIWGRINLSWILNWPVWVKVEELNLILLAEWSHAQWSIFFLFNWREEKEVVRSTTPISRMSDEASFGHSIDQAT